MATPATEKSKTGTAQTGKSTATTRKSASRNTGKSDRQSSRRTSDGRFKSLSNRSRSLGVSRNQAVGALAVTAVGIGVGLLLNWLRHRDDDQYFSPAAFADGERTHRENFDQTRAAGPDAMRDKDGHDWDRVDQALDESFPASDPASTY